PTPAPVRRSTPLSPSPLLLSFLSPSPSIRYLHSFPTRRSSDLFGYGDGTAGHPIGYLTSITSPPVNNVSAVTTFGYDSANRVRTDRKSTRLNSSHLVISYAVFCLKKKKNIMYKCMRSSASYDRT